MRLTLRMRSAEPGAGPTFVQSFSQSLREQSLSLKILGLAWTAGPVTYIALVGSYAFAYGKLPPGNLLKYFIGYTAVSGLISITFNALNHATFRKRQHEAAERLAAVIQKLSELIVSVRNEKLRHMELRERTVAMATLLLWDPDASESGLQTAVEDLTGNVELARALSRLDTYRRKGAQIRVEDEAEEIRNAYGSELARIEEETPQAAALIESRLLGRAPSKRTGTRRNPGFLERFITISETARLEEVSLTDVEELLKLILEMLLGRRITVLRWKLRGDHPIVERSIALDALHQRRAALRRRWRIVLHGLRHQVTTAGSSIRPSFSRQEIDGWLDDVVQATEGGESELRALIESVRAPALRRVLEAHSFGLLAIRRGIRAVDDKIEAQSSHVQRLRHPFRSIIRAALPRNGSAELELDIDEEGIGLSPDRRSRLAAELSEHLHDVTPARDRTRVLTEHGSDDDEVRPLEPWEIKIVAYELFRSLEKYVDLTHEYIVDGLESSFAINFSTIDTRLSRKVKLDWLHALAEEIQENLYPVAVHTAVRFTRHFKERLSPEVIRQFVEQLGIAEEHVELSLALSAHEPDVDAESAARRG